MLFCRLCIPRRLPARQKASESNQPGMDYDIQILMSMWDSMSEEDIQAALTENGLPATGSNARSDLTGVQFAGQALSPTLLYALQRLGIGIFQLHKAQ